MEHRVKPWIAKPWLAKPWIAKPWLAKPWIALLAATLVSGVPLAGHANEADVVAVDVTCRELVCDFAVTLKHADTGWEHYADGWEVLSEQGEVLAKRALRHPHVQEQPFTRSLSGVKLPEGTVRVVVRGHDKLHGHGGAELSVAIPPASSPSKPRVVPNP